MKQGFRIGNRVRELRFQQGEISQEQLAEKVGVTRQTIIAIEKGNYSPSLELAFQIAAAFEMEIGQVFYLETKAN